MPIFSFVCNIFFLGVRRVQSDGSANVSSYVSSSYMSWGAIYVTAMGFLATNIPYDPKSARVQLVAAVAFVDCFLLIFGHTWDHVPSLHTIMNCRLLYVVTWAIINVITYATFSGLMGTQFFASIH
jgi:hypothetical protein